MNTKNSKGLIGITLAFIMISSVFAAIVPSITADVRSQAGFSLDKQTYPDTLAKYHVGDTINYTIKATNTGSFNCTVDIWDILPDGTTKIYLDNDSYFSIGKVKWYNFSRTIESGWVDPNMKINNTVYAVGEDETTDTIDTKMTKTSTILAENPPSFNFTWEAVGCMEVEFVGTYEADPGVTIYNHTWNFHDGPGSTITKLGPPGTETWTFGECSAVTPHYVTLSGYDTNGLSNDTSDVIYVACPPSAHASPNPTCFEGGGSLITFTGSADVDPNVPGLTITSYHWEFDDGGNGSSDDAAVTSRMVNDTVIATLTVVDSLNCTAVATAKVSPCSLCNIRIYGTYDHGAGDLEAFDVQPYPKNDGKIRPENKPYSDPQGPFYPQSDEAPRKDFITFNPAIMDSNQGSKYSYADYEIDYAGCGNDLIEKPAMKVFKRMWYEKEWFKDFNENGEWDIVTTAGVMNWSTWYSYPQWQRPEIIQSNNPDVDGNLKADVYGPAIIQEFTYMTLDDYYYPALIDAGGEILIPLAHDPKNPYRGLNSFDADGDGIRDPVRVESEQTIGIDIDGDGTRKYRKEPMNNNSVELDGDEQVVFVLDKMDLTLTKSVQFFDLTFKLNKVPSPYTKTAVIDVTENTAGGKTWTLDPLDLDQSTTDVDQFTTIGNLPDKGKAPVFYIKLIEVGLDYATVEIGRMFGQTYANSALNPYSGQKVFIVDQVYYNVVAIKAEDNCFKYITFRQKLPKVDIKIFGKHLKKWAVDPDTGKSEVLAEPAPFSEWHEILPDINPINSTRTEDPYPAPLPIVKVPPKSKKIIMPPLEIIYVDEDHELRYKGALKEIYNESLIHSNTATAQGLTAEDEYWNLEWFWTQPWQYTEFRLPKNDRYLVTLSWIAPEAETTLWDGVPGQVPVGNWTGERFKFWYEDCTGPLYIDRATGSIRLYGTFGEGAGDPNALDKEPYLGNTGLSKPENMPYTDPVGPFFPQNEQAPDKDFMTFNPAIMDHNQGYPELDYVECDGYYGKIVQRPKEKVFKRMWYEKEWFKDSNGNGVWDVVIEKYSGGKWVFDTCMTLDAWNAIPDWQKLRDQRRIREYNNPDHEDPPYSYPCADIYNPAIVQEFTYMTVDTATMPIMVMAGSEILIPLAHNATSPYRGLNSFDADGDGIRDPVRVESEQTIGIDIDGDGTKKYRKEPMNNNTKELDGDEQVVFVLGPKDLTLTNSLQFFDLVIKLNKEPSPFSQAAAIDVTENTEGGKTQHLDLLEVGQFTTIGKLPDSGKAPVFYIKVLDVGPAYATVEVGRMFGQTHANSALNPFSGQKVFIVDQVYYNVVAIKAEDNCFKYITFRQKLPKDREVKLFGKHLKGWHEGDYPLPEPAPFSEWHEILDDVQGYWGPAPACQQDKIGLPKRLRPPLNISYVAEDEEWRFLGELKEIYNETLDANGTIETEYWNVEWFHTLPMQYTAFVVPDGELYLMTLAWVAPQAEITLWDGMTRPAGNWTRERVKFWYDPLDDTDILINRVGNDTQPAVVLTIAGYYNQLGHGGDGDPLVIGIGEVLNAVLDYLTDAGPFAPGADPQFTKNDLLNFVMDYLAQP